MKLKILYPSDYFDNRLVDDAYLEEYTIAKSIGFECVLFNYDEFINSHILRLKNNDDEKIILLYRGWMLKVDDYKILDEILSQKNYVLINTPYQYKLCHHFDEAYYFLDGNINTPKISVFKFEKLATKLNDIKNLFVDYFIMKDNVKSVKNTDFPEKISVNINEDEFLNLINKFKNLRLHLYTGEIVLKQYVNLKKYDFTTNEWRVFYFLGKILTVSKNSNQPESVCKVPDEIINNSALKSLALSSMFYTADFAEIEDGTWILIETGDGQVSGLSPNQNILEFYSKIQKYWMEQYKLS